MFEGAVTATGPGNLGFPGVLGFWLMVWGLWVFNCAVHCGQIC